MKKAQYKYVSTGIPSLDKMLGGKGFRTGTINIIKGGAGSGKTTLGLQILNGHLKNNLLMSKSETTCEIHNAIFLSLEVMAESTIKYARESYSFDFISSKIETYSEQNDNFCFLARADFEDALATSINKETISNPLFLLRKKIEEKNIELISKNEGNNKNIKNIFFIDSLNVLVDILNSTTYQNYDLRTLVNLIYESLPIEEFKTNTVFLFSVEYRANVMNSESLFNESFMSDSEILLNVEAVKGQNTFYTKDLCQTGYNIQVNDRGEKIIDIRPFVRVLKSRYSKNESRRCLYDIVKGTGLKFYDTYPGDGEINLFQENRPQKKHWKEFLKHDIKFSYPALRCKTFNRRALQRTFISLRQFKYIPEKTDLYLISLDNYWINWYADLKRKWLIQDVLSEYIERNTYEYNEICNYFHTELTKNKLKIQNIKALIQESLDIKFKIDYAGAKDNNTENLLKDQCKEKLADFFFDSILDYLSDRDSVICYQCYYLRWLKDILYKDLKEKGSEELKKYEDDKVDKMSIDEIFEWVDKIRKGKDIPNYNDDKEAYKVLETLARLSILRLRMSYKCDFISQFFTSINKTDKIIECQRLFAQDYPEREQKFKKVLAGIRSEFLKEYGKETEIVINNSTYCVSILDVFIKSDIISREKPDLLRELLRNDFENIFRESYYKTLMSICCGGKVKNTNNLSAEEKNKITNALCGFINIFYSLNQTNSASLLKMIPKKSLRIFGEKKSQIIKELDRFIFTQNRPIHYADRLFSWRDKNNYISIPYNANIGYLVYKKEGLKAIYDKVKEYPDRYFSKIADLVYNQIRCLINEISSDKSNTKNFHLSAEYLKELISKLDFGKKDEKKIKKGIEKKIKNYISEQTIEQLIPPKTWEEIMALATFKQENENILLIETRTFDTYLSTLLEFFWSFGGDLNILPDYSISNPNNTFCQLFLSYYLLGQMFKSGTIPLNSTLEPEYIEKYYNQSKNNWFFARHWHSTFVEYLTRSSSKNIEQSANIEFEIIPIPTSMINLLNKEGNIKHVSCWGDWHLAMTAGSENDELGIDLLNNLMSSRKISERAFCGAELPTAEIFYKLYNDVKCFNFPIDNKEIPPRITFREIRETLFANAKSRTQIFDYRHTMRELHSVLEFVHHSIQNENFSDTEFSNKLFRRLRKVFEEIKKFSRKEMLYN